MEGLSITVVMVVGVAILASAALRFVECHLFWATTWRHRREGRKQYAEKEWNTVAEEIPEGRYVVAVCEGWKPVIAQRKGGRMVSDGIIFDLDSCAGWLELPQMQDI